MRQSTVAYRHTPAERAVIPSHHEKYRSRRTTSTPHIPNAAASNREICFGVDVPRESPSNEREVYSLFLADSDTASSCRLLPLPSDLRRAGSDLSMASANNWALLASATRRGSFWHADDEISGKARPTRQRNFETPF